MKAPSKFSSNEQQYVTYKATQYDKQIHFLSPVHYNNQK